MDSFNSLFILFLIHRLFLFLDEWGLYFTLAYLYFKKLDYRLFLIIMFYGVACIITSYYNIHQIEAGIIKISVDDDRLKLYMIVVHRMFLYLNEWLLYLSMIYIFFVKRDYKLLVFISIYGLSRVFISYCNLDRIEEGLSHVHQKIWLFDFLRI